MPVRRVFSLSVFVMGVLVLTACSHDEAPQAMPSIVRPTAVTDTSTPGATTRSGATDVVRVPAAARAHTPAGAQAFAEFYLHQINEAWMSADPTKLAGLADVACKTCVGYRETAESLHRDGQHYASAPAKYLGSTWMPNSSRDRVFVQVVTRALPAVIVDRMSRQVKHAQPGTITLSLTITGQSGEQWTVAKVQRVVAR